MQLFVKKYSEYAPLPSLISYLERYLREGILALLPLHDHNGDKTWVITRKKAYRERRSLAWTVRRIAGSYNLDLQAMRKHYGRLLCRRHHISLPFSESLVLLPVKVRSAREAGEITNGYINLAEIAAVAEMEPQAGVMEPQASVMEPKAGEMEPKECEKKAQASEMKAQAAELALPASDDREKRNGYGTWPNSADQAPGGAGKAAPGVNQAPPDGTDGASGPVQGPAVRMTEAASPPPGSGRAEPAAEPATGEGAPPDLVDAGEAQSKVVFVTGLELPTLYNIKTLKERLQQGQAVVNAHIASRDRTLNRGPAPSSPAPRARAASPSRP